MASLKKYLGAFGFVDSEKEEQTAGEFKNRLEIKTPSLTHEVGKLSGGNQQKVMFSKWLNTQPRIFILDEPTRGIDIGAKAEVHQMIRELAKEGIAIICISSDLPEVKNGLGIYILSTNKGLMSDKDARSHNIGGEVICEVF